MKVSDLLTALKSWPANLRLDDPMLLEVCRSLLFSGFDPANVKKTIKNIELLRDQEALLDEDVDNAYKEYERKKNEGSQIHVEEDGGIHREGRALTSKELEVFLEDYEKHRAIKNARELAKKILEDPIIAKSGLSLAHLERRVQLKREVEERIVEKLIEDGVSPDEAKRSADSRSDEVVRTYERIEIVDVEKIVGDKDRAELAEKIVEQPEKVVVEEWFEDKKIVRPVLKKVVIDEVVHLIKAETILEDVVTEESATVAEVLAEVYGYGTDDTKKARLQKATEVIVKENLIRGTISHASRVKVNMDESKSTETGSSTLDKAKEIGQQAGDLASTGAGIPPEIKAADKRTARAIAKDVTIAMAVLEVRKKLETLDMVLAASEQKQTVDAELIRQIEKVEPRELREDLVNELNASGDTRAIQKKVEEAVARTELIKVEPRELRQELEKLLNDGGLTPQEVLKEIDTVRQVAEVKKIVELANSETTVGEKIKIVTIKGDLAGEDPLVILEEREVLAKDLESGKVVLKENEVVGVGVMEEYLAYRQVIGNKFPSPEIPTQQAVVVNNLIKLAKKGGSIRTVVDRINQLPESVGKGNTKVMALRDLARQLSQDNYALVNSLEKIAKFTNLQDKVNDFVAPILMRAGQTLGLNRLTEFGVQLAYRWGGQTAGSMATHIAATGSLENGLISILSQLMKTGSVKAIEFGSKAVATTATAGTAVAGTAAAEATAVLAAGTGVGIPVALMIMAVTVMIDKLKSLKGKVSSAVGSVVQALGIMDPREWENFKMGISKMGSGIVKGVLTVGIAIVVGFKILLSGLVFPTAIVVITLVAIPLYNHIQTATTQASPLVINKGTINSNCVKKEDLDDTEEGEANCNKNAPSVSYPGLDKARFVEVANRWSAGANSAEACYNDVVNRALCAGVHPGYALWAWLHESGASNYSIPDVEDFGIHGIPSVPPKNFDAQITYFLKLDPGSRCVNDPRIGGDYWLGFATNYLNGSCDPDEPNKSSGQTGRQYLAELKTTWGWINSSPMPNGIRVAKGGSCGSSGSNGTKEVIGPDGEVYICSTSTDPVSEIIKSNEQSGTIDPDAPGLPGEEIPGECSVGDKVVLTKQCGQAWSSKPLPGGSGTICSAGCGPTSVSMMLRRVNGSMTPDNVIYAPGSAYSSMNNNGSSLDQAYVTLVKQFGGGAVTSNATTRSCTPKDIGAWVCSGKVVMVLANFYRNREATSVGGHFVLAVAVQDGNIITADPYYNVSTPFDGKKEYGHIAQVRGCITVEASAIK